MNRSCCGRRQAEVTRAKQALAQEARNASREMFCNGRTSPQTKEAIVAARRQIAKAEENLIEHEADHAADHAADAVTLAAVNAVYS